MGASSTKKADPEPAPLEPGRVASIRRANTEPPDNYLEVIEDDLNVMTYGQLVDLATKMGLRFGMGIEHKLLHAHILKSLDKTKSTGAPTPPSPSARGTKKHQ